LPSPTSCNDASIATANAQPTSRAIAGDADDIEKGFPFHPATLARDAFCLKASSSVGIGPAITDSRLRHR